MLNTMFAKTGFVGGILAVLLTAGAVRAVCTEGLHNPGQPVCSVCCVGPCICIPNASSWGYHTRQWRPWPGDQYRQDVVFPQSIGVERIAAPRGEKPKLPPKEEYAETRSPSITRPTPAYSADPNARQALPPIREGLPTGPMDPYWPMDSGLEFNPNRPGPETDRSESPRE